jgi:hypothetical protein
MKTSVCVAGDSNVAREPHHVGCIPADKLRTLDRARSPGFPRTVEHCDGKRVRLAYPWSCFKNSKHGPATWVVSAKYASADERDQQFVCCDACVDAARTIFRNRDAVLIEEEPLDELESFDPPIIPAGWAELEEDGMLEYYCPACVQLCRGA